MAVLVGSIVLVVGTLAYVFGGAITMRAVRQRERLEVISSLDRVSSALAYSSDQLSKTAGDWANWDATYDFVQGKNPSYAEENLDQTAIDVLDLDFMMFYDVDRRRVHTLQTERAGSPRPLPAELDDCVPEPSSVVPTRTGFSGIVDLPQGLAQVAVTPVLRSNGSGPHAGAVLFGRFVGGEELQVLSALSGVQVELLSLDDARVTREVMIEGADRQPVIVPVDEDTITGYMPLTGPGNRPEAIAKVTRPRTTMMLNREYRLFAVSSVGLALAILTGTIFLTLDSEVLKPLSRLAEDVRNVGGATLAERRVPVTGSDEISVVGHEVNAMLETLSRYERRLHHMADHDELTGLSNRRRFGHDIERELAAAKRLGRRLAVLLLDLDNFKDINDAFGHAAGDAILTEFAGTLVGAVRAYSSVARVGGDEFAVVLPDAGETDAITAAERILREVAGMRFTVDANQPDIGVDLSVSVGVALYPEHGDTAELLLVAADLAMYRAKRAGGDRFAASTGPVPNE